MSIRKRITTLGLKTGPDQSTSRLPGQEWESMLRGERYDGPGPNWQAILKTQAAR